jgi:DNA (cytosine-5)-methyltransferase 1
MPWIEGHGRPARAGRIAVFVLLADVGFMGQFDAVHASPPCQAHSATRALALAQGAGPGRAKDLVEPVAELLRRWGGPWVMENVDRSPLQGWPGAVRLCGSAWGLQVQRHRWFAPSPGVVLTAPACDHFVFEPDPVT